MHDPVETQQPQHHDNDPLSKLAALASTENETSTETPGIAGDGVSTSVTIGRVDRGNDGMEEDREVMDCDSDKSQKIKEGRNNVSDGDKFKNVQENLPMSSEKNGVTCIGEGLAEETLKERKEGSLEICSDTKCSLEIGKDSSCEGHGETERETKKDEVGDYGACVEKGFNGKNQLMSASCPGSGVAANDKGENVVTIEGSVAAPPPPVLKGTLSYNLELKRHVIRGMWNYENSNSFPPQRFELIRNLNADEDPTELPMDGEFHGSFSLAYFHTTSKGKQKERSKVIPESGVNIKFAKIEGKEKEFNIDGQGTNQFGIFNINGTATPSAHDGDPSYNIELRKRYAPSQSPSAVGLGSALDARGQAKKGKKNKKRKHGSMGATNDDDGGDQDGTPLPLPTKEQEGVVCLRGKLSREQSDELGVTNVVHRITGMWSSGIKYIIEDPQNTQGFCNRFEYEHKSTVPSEIFPLSGRYTGWFDLTQENGQRARISERDVTLKFRKNSEGYYNVEGRGSNNFGKYKITGTLTNENMITIFRHFHPIKTKSREGSLLRKVDAVTAAPPPLQGSSEQGKRQSVQVLLEPVLKLDEVVIPGGLESETPEPIPPPSNGAYSAVSRGVLRLNDADGAHTCSGKWAITRDHFNNGQTSNFHFRLEPHFAAEAAKATKKMGSENVSPCSADSTNLTTISAIPPLITTFPVDSAMYKGTFQMRRGATKYQTVIDQQIALKFRKNVTGSYNVHGRGINNIGKFDLVGSLIMSGKNSGHVELYRIYHAVAATSSVGDAAALKGVASSGTSTARKSEAFGKNSVVGAGSKPVDDVVRISPSSSSVVSGGLSQPILVRRESSRTVKVPSRLEDDDPQAQLSRIMEKCRQHLQFLKEKDMADGAFFSEPVDPVAHGIPNYHEVISEPMDLGTIQKKMDAGEITTPEYFGSLVRLIFENAMTFNVEPTHLVHQAGRSLLILFNQKFREVEVKVEQIRRSQKPSEAEIKEAERERKKKEKEEAKKARKKYKEEKKKEVKLTKSSRLEDAQAMKVRHSRAMAAVEAAAPQNAAAGASVTRAEFNLMLQMIQQLQGHVVKLHTSLANSSNSGEASLPASAGIASHADNSSELVTSTAIPEKVKKKLGSQLKSDGKPRETVVLDEQKALTLKEQEQLTDTINRLPADTLPGVIQIIRESTQLGDEDDEIDLEIDQLDTATQRKLQLYVKKHVRPPQKQKTKQAPKKQKVTNLLRQTQIQKDEVIPVRSPSVVPARAPNTAKQLKYKSAAQQTKTTPDSFFAFQKDSDSDSDSNGDSDSAFAPSTQPGGKEMRPSTADNDFNVNSAIQEDEDDDDVNNGSFATNWNLSNTGTRSSAEETVEEGSDGNDLWGAAVEKAAASKQREAERKALEDKMIADAELAKKERLEAAAAKGKEIRMQRIEEKANEARLQVKQEKEAEDARKAARDAARAQVQSVEQTVDLDAQRDIMKQYEQSFLDKELGGSASPSSDFGF